MTVPDQSLDPHLEEVLRDIEGDPRARMFQASPRQLVTVLTDRSPRLSSRQAGLTSAERELLTVHREELAYLLYSAARSMLVENKDARTPVGRWFTPDLKLELLPRSQWLERALFCRSAYPPALLPDPAYSLLGEQVATDRSTPLSCCAMALAALRLVPSTAPRIVMAYALQEEGLNQSSLTILADILKSRCVSVHRAIVYINTASVLSRLGNDGDAIDLLEEGKDYCGSHIGAALNSFTISLRIGDCVRACLASERISFLVPPDHPAIEEFVGQRIAQLRVSKETPTKDCLRILPRIREKLPDAARRIADVY